MEALHVPDDDGQAHDDDDPSGVNRQADDNDKYDRAIIDFIKRTGVGYLHVAYVDRIYYYDYLYTSGYVKVSYGPGTKARRIPLD